MEMEPLEERRFTVDEVLSMVAHDVLDEAEPVELLDGRLVVVSPQGHDHVRVITLLADRLRALVRPGATVLEEKPLKLDERSLPEPDITIVRGRYEDYEELPRASDALLVIEVAVTSQRLDRAKRSLYARAGIPVYWLVDVAARSVTVHQRPRPDGTYAAVVEHASDTPLAVPGSASTIAIDELLPRR